MQVYVYGPALAFPHSSQLQEPLTLEPLKLADLALD